MFVAQQLCCWLPTSRLQQLCCWLPCSRASTALLLVVHNTHLNSFAVGYPLAGFNSFAVGYPLAGLQQLCCWCGVPCKLNSFTVDALWQGFNSFAVGVVLAYVAQSCPSAALLLGSQLCCKVNSFAVVALSSPSSS